MSARWTPRISRGTGSGGGPPPPTQIDYFAPKIIVGNVLAGDSPVNHSAGGFYYIADPGNGTGIAAAIALLVGLGFAADICIRAGTYTRAPGLPRFVVPADCWVWSPGGANIITNDVDDCIFQVGAGVSLDTLTLTHRGVLAGIGVALVECPVGAAFRRTHLRDVRTSCGVLVPSMSLTQGDYEVNSCEFLYTGLPGTSPNAIVLAGGATRGVADIHDCAFSLFNTPVRIGFAGLVQDTRIVNNRFLLTAGVVPIAAGAGTTNSLALGNISRGGGGTLPTDAGLGNSINPGVANIWGA